MILIFRDLCRYHASTFASLFTVSQFIITKEKFCLLLFTNLHASIRWQYTMYVYVWVLCGFVGVLVSSTYVRKFSSAWVFMRCCLVQLLLTSSSVNKNLFVRKNVNAFSTYFEDEFRFSYNICKVSRKYPSGKYPVIKYHVNIQADEIFRVKMHESKKRTKLDTNVYCIQPLLAWFHLRLSKRRYIIYFIAVHHLLSCHVIYLHCSQSFYLLQLIASAMHIVVVYSLVPCFFIPLSQTAVPRINYKR